MQIKFIAFLLTLLLFISSCTVSRPVAADRVLVPKFDSIIRDAASQYKLLAGTLPADRFPRNFDPRTGKLTTSGSDWWCSGFYPGTLLYLYEHTGDTALYAEAMRILNVLEKEKHNTNTHDLGFMMYCSFGNARRIHPKPGYEDVLLTSARSLASRFSPVVGAIRSWNSNPSDFLVIIDNMMNLELLFWAARFTGDSAFYKIAVSHANTTIQNHFRSDHSSYHVLNYHPATGEVMEKKTHQGYSDASAWSRGQAWGLYGYVMTYRETGIDAYLQQAKKIAGFILNHPNLPADKIPYWDFNDPSIPNSLRDASAAAIMASALLELSTYADAKQRALFFSAAETILKNLSSPEYVAAQGTNGGFILKHGVGHLPASSEVDVALTYADYYYIEALGRYKMLVNKKN